MRLTTLSTIVAIAIASISVSAYAEQIDTGAAMRTAQRYVSKNNITKSFSRKSDKLTLAYTAQSIYDEDLNCYYVFNRSNGGFVITAADDCAQQILGTCDEGTFNYQDMPENMRWWLDTYTAQISEAMQNNAASVNESDVQRAAKGRQTVEALLTTKWDQGTYYNAECPVIDGKPTYTGCVATALGQVMKYHNWPETGKGTVSYINDNYSKTDTVPLTVNFEDGNYDWANMPDQLDKNSTPEQVKAVSHLLYHAGVAVYTTYGNGGSNAYMSNIVRLYEHLGYAKCASYRERNYFTDAEWENIIYNEISNHRPVCYSGGGMLNRHAFVCDGYKADDNTFHFNWGWGGNGNGYFKMSALAPFGDSKTQYVYNQNQGAVIGIDKPNATNDHYDTPIIAYGNLTMYYKTGIFRLALEKVPNSETKNLFTGILDYNCTSTSLVKNISEYTNVEITDSVRVKLVNVDTREVTYIKSNTPFGLNNLHNNWKFGSGWDDWKNYIKIGCSYEASPEFKNFGSDVWQPVIHSEQFINKVILHRAADGTLTCEQVKSPANLNIDKVNVDQAIAGKDLVVDVTLSNLGQSDYEDMLELSLINANGEKAVTFSENADVPSKTTKTVNINGSLQNIESGTYAIRISNAEGQAVSDTDFPVSVKKTVYTGIEEINNQQLAVTVDGNVMNVTAESEISSVKVYNTAGALVASAACEASNNVTLSIGAAETGIYMVKAVSGNDTIVEQILIKRD